MLHRLQPAASSLLNAHRRWGASGWADFAVAWLVLPVFAARLHLFGSRAIKLTVDRDDSQEYMRLACQLAVIVNSAARFALTRNTCLNRSIVLQWMLQRRRIPCELVIGAAHAPGLLDAHAWVECAGIPVNDAPGIAARFPPLASGSGGATGHT